MEQKLSDILDNLLGMLLLEGSYEVEENEDSFSVSIKTTDAGRLIGVRGESLDALQVLVNQIMFRQAGENAKRVIIDVEGWRKQKEEELTRNAQDWGKQVLESGKTLELEPQSPWQRRIIHMVISEMKGLESESAGEGRDRHIVIKVTGKKDPKNKLSAEKSEAKSEEQNIDEAKES